MEFLDEIPYPVKKKSTDSEPHGGLIFYNGGIKEFKFHDIIDYMTELSYLEDFTWEEKSVFEHKVGP